MQQYGFLIIMAALLVAMMVFSSRSRKRMAAQQQEQQRMLNEGLVPGVWVKTSIGFWGRFVDQDGDVVILETPDGTETYWERQAIRAVGDPPFASDEPAEVPEVHEEEERVLGLDHTIDPEPPANPIQNTDDDNRK